MKKRLALLGLLICICLFSCQFKTYADEYTIIDSGNCGANGNNLIWKLYTDGELIIEGSGEMTNYTYNGAPWKEYYRQITTISLPDGITYLGNYAFYYCTKITSISIPDSVTKIGSNAFSLCTSLVDVVIPDSVSTIAAGAFSSCTSLKSVSLPNKLTSIYDLLFSNCSNLESINLPTSIGGIGGFAFSNCKKLSSISLPEGTRYINAQAFGGCISLKTISLPTSVKWIRDGAFVGCSGLTDVYYGGTIEGRETYNALLHSWSNIDNNLLYVANWHYAGNHFILASGKCGANDDNLDWTLFEYGHMIISGEGAIKNFYKDGDTWAINGERFNVTIKSVILEEGITKIGNYAFQQCENLTSIVIPDSVSSYGNEPFVGCTQLITSGPANGDYNIKIDCKTKDLHTRFEYFPYLSSVVIPDGVETIGNAFYNCNQLSYVKIPGSVTSIGMYAFEKCENLKDVYYDGIEEQWKIITKNLQDSSLIGVEVHFIIPDFILPMSLSIIDDEAFAGGSFSFVKTSENIEKIGASAFANCPNLTYIFIPAMTADIDENAFGNTKNLTIFGKEGSTVEDYAFNHDYIFMKIP